MNVVYIYTYVYICIYIYTYIHTLYISQKQDIYFLTSYIYELYNSLRNKCLVFDIYIDIFVHDIQSLYKYIYIYLNDEYGEEI